MLAHQLYPLPQPIGLFPAFTARQTETLVLREKTISFTGDDSVVTLASTGQPLLRLRGKALSVSDRTAILDAATGSKLVDIVREHFHLHTKYAAVDERGTKVLEVEFGFKLVGTSAKVTFTNPSTGRREMLSMRGNWAERNAEIVDEATGAVVARVGRRLWSGRAMFLNRDTYDVVVAPGADMVLVSALCLCFDEKRRRDESRDRAL